MRPGSGQRATETRLNPARAPGRGAARPEPLPPAGPPQAPASCPARPPARLPEPRSAVTWALRGHRPELGSRRGRPALSPRPLPCIIRAGPTLSEASRLRGSALGCRPRSTTASAWPLCRSRAETLNPLGCGARLSAPELAPGLASARQPCGLAWGPSRVFLRI